MSKSPDYILKVMNKITNQKSNKIGVGFANDNNSITLIVDWPNEVKSDPKGELIYTLFPNDGKVISG